MASITSLRCILAHLSIAYCLKAFTASAFLYSVLLLQIFVRGKLLFSRGYLAATNEYRGPIPTKKQWQCYAAGKVTVGLSL